MKKNFDIDRDYLRRCTASTPEQRLDWLAAAQEFVQEVQKNRPESDSKVRHNC